MDESAASGCTEWAGGQCENLGICVIVETDDDAQPSPAQAMWTEILASGTDVLELETPIYGRLPFVHLSGRLFGVFDCQGDLALIASLGRDGRVLFDRPDESMTSVRISDVWARVRSAELQLP